MTVDLPRTGWLSRLGPTLAAEIVSAGRTSSFPAGKTIFAIGDEQPNLYCTVSGTVRFDVTMNEQTPRFAHLAGPGFWFGEIAFLSGNAAAVETLAATDVTVFCVNRQKFDVIASRNPDAWRGIAVLAAMNQTLAVGAGDDLLIRNARQRFCATLLRLAARRNAFQGQVPLDFLRLTQSDLSTATNLSRSRSAEILRDLSRKGIIRTEYGGIAILSAESLMRELE